MVVKFIWNFSRLLRAVVFLRRTVTELKLYSRAIMTAWSCSKNRHVNYRIEGSSMLRTELVEKHPLKYSLGSTPMVVFTPDRLRTHPGSV